MRFYVWPAFKTRHPKIPRLVSWARRGQMDAVMAANNISPFDLLWVKFIIFLRQPSRIEIVA